ncbi:precorrin-6y C5,15-methyltransferase (decarboxylating) subunit CbiE [Rhodococcus spelaei]|uniref:Precorrin-6y C5,15-methyltransferase (Decarboxylating) subunit CbiE n=1 Tax=Rhodococcus spelaei TaxID=2546320 RepID=A0A541B826_9NOCA|nr:precorrin-6y C5,15-methyltransferase (decarboxylating) subunit CbiE [Rhodococcus spelaei]TQF68476.1 precorrin-6y C5,15-methyltransferase (decarboxylating) subunit CbiE [Rhodococcus spelaei]
MLAPVAVVGIGADGWDGLSPNARRAVIGADVLMGSPRQLDLVPTGDARRVPWPTPLVPALPGLLAEHAGHRICVLASGDPMFHGIGVTLIRLLGPNRVRVLAQPSSASLACARLGWALHETPVVSLVSDPVSTLLPELSHDRRMLVLSRDEHTPALVAELLREHGFGETDITVLEQLGGPAEVGFRGRAAGWTRAPGDRLNLLALHCLRTPGAVRHTRIPGLPDDAFASDGQLTKREVRALTLAALAPEPGELLWDVGGGSGSIAIEWMRTDRTCRAVGFERDADRRDRIAENALRLGVPALEVRGAAPASLADAPTPDAVFLGGGVTAPGVFEACWAALDVGGRMVVNAVTAESEALLLRWRSEYGGELRKFQIYRGSALGGFTAWRPHLPVAQWIATKETNA